MTELEQVARRSQCTGRVVDLDRSVLGPGRRVDEDRRQPRAAYRLDLRMVSIEPDDDHAVDRRAGHRKLDRAVQRRDEEKTEATILRDGRDALGEEREEGVGKHLRKRLWR